MQTARKTAAHPVDTVRQQPQPAHDTGRRRRLSAVDAAADDDDDANNNFDAVDYSAASGVHRKRSICDDDGNDDDVSSSTTAGAVQSLVGWKSSGGRNGWSVKATSFAHNTINPIRRIIEGLKIEPNPEKFMIPLSIGDPTTFGNLNAAPETIRAVRECLDSGEFNGYGHSCGLQAARQAVADYVRPHQGNPTLGANDVVLCSGCSSSLDLCIAVLAGPGQNILIPRPGFSIYRTLALGHGVEVRSYDLLPERNWEADLEQMERLIDGNTAALVLTNPSNPCGSVFTRQHLQRIVRVAERHFVPIIADEIYEHFVFPGIEYVAVSEVARSVPVLSCGGLTKRFLVPGWRMGWIVVHDRGGVLDDVRKGLESLSTRILGGNMLVQGALPAILRDTPQAFFDGVLATLHKHATLAFELLSRVPGLRPIRPDGAMYMMIGIDVGRFPGHDDDLQFVQALVGEQSVFCLPGRCFDYPNYMRIVLTVPEEMIVEACARIAQFCEVHYRPAAVAIESAANLRHADESNGSSFMSMEAAAADDEEEVPADDGELLAGGGGRLNELKALNAVV